MRVWLWTGWSSRVVMLVMIDPWIEKEKAAHGMNRSGD
ncbi:hypothetical protein BVG79_00884 [Ketogulonicigenium robustum]|uniref:Uncharacterized protein n=1 Tax=Ketogulonicigenium robustum TaxID=92947 RepID=A0A1W6NYA6_9RHOB|nr:hypothetical protein BVG79_00884 [Ketogulonicigenium robustum]